jgi:hypothetical protein
MAKYGISHGSIPADLYSVNQLSSAYWQDHAESLAVHRLGAPLILAILGLVSNANLESIAYFPLPGILLPVLGFLIVRTLTNSRGVALLFFAFFTFEIGMDRFNFIYHAWGFVLHFTVLLVVIKLLKTDNSVLRHSRSLSAILFLLIFVSYQTYYHIEIFNFLLLTGIIASALVLKKLNGKKNISLNTKSLLIPALVVLLVVFGIDTVPYFYFEKGYDTKVLPTGQEIATSVFNILQMNTEEAKTFRSDLPSAAFYIDVGLGVIIVLSFAAFAFYAFLKRRSRPVRAFLEKNDNVILVTVLFALLLVSIGEMAVYLGAGEIVARYLFGLLPIAAIYSMYWFSTTFKRNTVIRIACFVVIFSMISLNIAKYNILTNDIAYKDRSSGGYISETQHITDWLLSHMQQGKILTSHRISGIIFGASPDYNKDNTIVSQPFEKNIKIFEKSVLGNDGSELCSFMQTKRYDMLIVSEHFEDRVILGQAWGGDETSIKPIGESLHNLNNFGCLDRVYSDNHLQIYRTEPSIK